MGDSQTDSSTDGTADVVGALRGDASDRVTLLGVLYRGEVDRATTWRGRLDQTTNWAVVLVAAILTWSFSSQDNPHYLLLIGMLAVVAFLLIEAHRFREYDIWRSRVRLMQEHLFVGVLRPGDSTDGEWQDDLSASLEAPTFTISYPAAVAHRLRRAYLALFTILFVAWIARISVFQTGEGWRETASVPGLDGHLVVSAVTVVYASLLLFAAWSARGTETREKRV